MITLSNINKRYLSQSALTDVNMTFPAHGFLLDISKFPNILTYELFIYN